MERLLEKGQNFASLSVDQLTKEAGMSRANFYLHFRDKGELLTRLIEYFTAELVDSTGDWLNNPANAQRRDVERALTGMVQTFKRHQVILAAMNDMAPFDPKVAALYHEMVETIAARSRRTLKTVKQRGRSRAGLNDDVVNIVSWMIVLYCARFIDTREGASLRQLGRSLGYISASAAFADSDD